MRAHAFVLCLAAFLAACGGGGGDGGGNPQPGDLWFGTLEDASFGLSTVSITIDGSDITEVLENGVSTGLTGTVGSPPGGLVREYSLTDGTSVVNGLFLIELAETHMAFADDGANFGVLQKSATGLPTYSYGDLNGPWSGRIVETDFAGTVIDDFGWSVACSPGTTLTCSITKSPTTYSANFSGAFDASFGRWEGDYVGPTAGSISAFLSPDKAFVGVWACADPDQFWPEDCVFMVWQR